MVVANIIMSHHVSLRVHKASRQTMTGRSDIPFGAQFSPNQVDLRKLLQIIHDHAGDRSAITKAIRNAFFANHAPAQQQKLADNTVLALRAYELLDDQGATPTRLAGELLVSATPPVG